MKLSILIAALAFSLMATPAFAQRTPRVTANQAQDQGKIRRGYHSGQLTRAEAARLEKEQAHIQQQKCAARADGVVTPQERRSLHRSQRQADRHIRRQKHDGQHRHTGQHHHAGHHG